MLDARCEARPVPVCSGFRSDKVGRVWRFSAAPALGIAEAIQDVGLAIPHLFFNAIAPEPVSATLASATQVNIQTASELKQLT
jgi:hypothetical protein